MLHFEWRHKADLFLCTLLKTQKLITNPKASRPRLEYERIQKDKT